MSYTYKSVILLVVLVVSTCFFVSLNVHTDTAPMHMEQSNGSKPMSNTRTMDIEADIHVSPTHPQNVSNITHSVSSLQLPSKIFDLGCGCSGSTSLFHFFHKTNQFKGIHYSTKINNKEQKIGEWMQKNLQLNRSILAGLPSHLQYLSDLKLCYMGGNGVPIVKALSSQNPKTLFIMTPIQISNHRRINIGTQQQVKWEGEGCNFGLIFTAMSLNIFIAFHNWKDSLFLISKEILF
eukprot:1069144_1